MDETSSKTVLIIPLSDYLERLTEEFTAEYPDYSHKTIRRGVRKIINEWFSEEFTCKKNEDIEMFLTSSSVDGENHNSTRTFLYINTLNGEDHLWGFYTLTIKIIDISEFEDGEKRKYIYKGKSPKHTDKIPVILLAQFGKNDRYTEQFSGYDLYQEAINTIQEARSKVGTQIVMLDSVNNPKVIGFYKQFGYKEFGEVIVNEDTHDTKYQPMFINLG